MTVLRSTLFALALGGLAALAPVAAAQTTPAASAFDPSDPRQKGYVDGNLIFLAYHEVGHLMLDTALVDQAADRRSSEEAADDVAIYIMLPDEDEPDQAREILYAIQGWKRSAASGDGVSISPHYPDDADRAARIACYLYGSNPDRFARLGKIFPNSIDSVDCEAEFTALTEDLDAWFGEALVKKGEKQGALPEVRYEDAPPALQAAKAYLESTELLEDVAKDIAQFINLPEDVLLVGQSCGRGSAEFRYSPGARIITACYEAVDWLMRDANDEEQVVAGGGEDRAVDGALGSGGSRVTQRPRTARPRR